MVADHQDLKEIPREFQIKDTEKETCIYKEEKNFTTSV